VLTSEIRSLLAARGIDQASLTRTKLPRPNYFDEIVCLEHPGTHRNREELSRRAEPVRPTMLWDVPDPWGGGIAAYEATYSILRGLFFDRFRIELPP
jgi:protein-tyrosine-phosphatase